MERVEMHLPPAFSKVCNFSKCTAEYEVVTFHTTFFPQDSTTETLCGKHISVPCVRRFDNETQTT